MILSKNSQRRIPLAFFLILCVCLPKFAASQINYVLNPSFEDTVACPNNFNLISFAKFWNGIDTNNIYSNCNADYYNGCSSFVGLPQNQYFNHSARTGNAAIALITASYDTATNSEIRDYAIGSISNNLIQNLTYCVKFYAIHLRTSSQSSNKQSAYLFNGALNYPIGLCQPISSVVPQLENTVVISDTTNWSKIEGIFISNGIESKIILGNFANHLNTQTIQYNSNAPYIGAFYMIDDVSVVDYNLPAFSGTDASIALGDSVYLGRPNEIGPECRWWANGTALNDSSLGFWAKPTQPTQYVLEQKICGNVKYDTVFVNIGHDGLNDSRRVGDNFKLLPNPSNGSFIISSTQATYNNVIIYSIDGKEVYNSKLVFTKGNANFDLDLPNGVYHVKLIGSIGVASQKLVISK